MDLEQNSGSAARLAEPSRKIQLLEVGTFLFLIVPSMVLSFLPINQVDRGFVGGLVGSILNDLALLSLVLYFIWRNHEPVQRVGWNFGHLRREIAWELLLFVPIIFGGNLLEGALRQAGLSAPSTPPSFLPMSGLAKVAVGFIVVTVVAMVEETVFRGYLILRFRTVAGGTSAAVLLSSLVFSLGHGNQGAAGAITVFVLGVVFALVYVWRKSLVAPIVIHFLTDFVSMVVIGP